MPDLLFTTHDDDKTRNDSDEGKNESCYGSSFQDYADIDKTVIVNCALNVPLMLLSILGNGLVLVTITRTPSIRSNSMILLGSLAVSDLLVGVIAQPLFIASELTKNNALVLQLSQMTVATLCGVSLSIITAITLDRFLALYYHLKYAGLVTKLRVQCTLWMIWLTIIFVMPSFHLWTTERTFFLLAAVVTVVCLTTSTFCYVRIYLIVVHHQLQIDVQQQAVQRSNLGNNFNIVRLARSAKHTFVFYTVLILCYCPIFVLMVFYGASYKNWVKEWNFATTVMFLNSSINPFLYCWRLGELRTAIIKTARQMICTQTRQN